MAGPRNQVAIPQFVDPYGKLSGTFKDLSTMYSDTASKDEALKLKEQELARMKILDAENARRWGVERGDVAAERARQEILDAENVRRWNLERDRLATLDQQNTEDRNTGIARSNAEKSASWRAANARGTFTVGSLPEGLKQNVISTLGQIDAEEDLAQRYLNLPDGKERTDVLNKIGKSRRAFYGSNKGLTTRDVDKNTANFVTRLEALGNELRDIKDPAERAPRIAAFRQNQYGVTRDSILEKVRSGDVLTREQQRSFILSQIPADERALLNAAELATKVDNVLANVYSRSDLMASENTMVDELNAREQQSIDNLLRWSNGEKGSTAKDSASAIAADKSIDTLDIGSSDTPNAKAFYESLKAEGMAPAFAASFTLGKIHHNVFGSSFIDATGPEATEYRKDAREKYKKFTDRYGSGETRLTREQLETKLHTPRSLEDLQGARLRVLPNTNSINVDPKYVEALVARSRKAQASTQNLIGKGPQVQFRGADGRTWDVGINGPAVPREQLSPPVAAAKFSGLSPSSTAGDIATSIELLQKQRDQLPLLPPAERAALNIQISQLKKQSQIKRAGRPSEGTPKPKSITITLILLLCRVKKYKIFS